MQRFLSIECETVQGAEAGQSACVHACMLQFCTVVICVKKQPCNSMHTFVVSPSVTSLAHQGFYHC